MTTRWGEGAAQRVVLSVGVKRSNVLSQGLDVMTYPNFFDALFELADMW